MSHWRLLDTGLRPAAENLALDRALLEAQAAGEAPPTLRFLRFERSALVGHHQDPRQELDLAYCREQGIPVQRRLTGGGAIYFEPAHLGCEVLDPRTALGGADMNGIARRLCEAAAAGLSALGVDARFRARNDIEVDGRKVGGTGGTVEDGAILYQGTVLTRMDADAMAAVLRVPAAKLADKPASALRERVTDLADLLGEAPAEEALRGALAEAFAGALGARFQGSGLLEAETRRFRRARTEIDRDDWVYAVAAPEAPDGTALYRCPGGLLRAAVRLGGGGRILRQAWLGGDLLIDPPRAVPDLEAALRDTPVAELRERVHAFFEGGWIEAVALGPDEIADALSRAVEAAA
ncbi:MAG TPA: lipoate--protein ligase family protein [Gammaproteobacteria bacterium]|nr:lipoate--protein ligase family protein [Gammaproteobacteria bacterium]